MSEIALTDSAPSEAHAVTESDFAGLVRENQAMVYSIALHSSNDPALAEELAQDVFLQLYRHLGRMESRGHVTNWLRRVATNRCIDFGRKQSVAREVDLEHAPEPATEDRPADPLLRERMRKLVAALPEKKRMLVILRYQEELELEEIARILRIPSRTVRTQLWRTLQQLREKATHLLGEAGAGGGARREVS